MPGDHVARDRRGADLEAQVPVGVAGRVQCRHVRAPSRRPPTSWVTSTTPCEPLGGRRVRRDRHAPACRERGCTTDVIAVVVGQQRRRATGDLGEDRIERRLLVGVGAAGIDHRDRARPRVRPGRRWCGRRAGASGSAAQARESPAQPGRSSGAVVRGGHRDGGAHLFVQGVDRATHPSIPQSARKEDDVGTSIS